MTLMEVFRFFFQISLVFLFNKPKTPALWTTLTFWIINIAVPGAVLTDRHAIFIRVEYLLHFMPPPSPFMIFHDIEFSLKAK